MAGESLSGAGPDREIPTINTNVPHPARVYDYFLGGKDNFEADRVAAEAANMAFPRTAESARAARAFLRRVVRFLAAEAGIRQFLDIGTGLPSGENVHQVAQSTAPESQDRVRGQRPDRAATRAGVADPPVRRVLSPTWTRTCATRRRSSPRPPRRWTSASRWRSCSWASCIIRRSGRSVRHRPQAGAGHARQAATWRYVTSPRKFTPNWPSGHWALNERQLDAPLVLRDHAQVTSFFEGLELLEPGVVQLSKWRPRSEVESAAAAALWGGVARKPA